MKKLVILINIIVLSILLFGCFRKEYLTLNLPANINQDSSYEMHYILGYKESKISLVDTEELKPGYLKNNLVITQAENKLSFDAQESFKFSLLIEYKKNKITYDFNVLVNPNPKHDELVSINKKLERLNKISQAINDLKTAEFRILNDLAYFLINTVQVGRVAFAIDNLLNKISEPSFYFNNVSFFDSAFLDNLTEEQLTNKKNILAEFKIMSTNYKILEPLIARLIRYNKDNLGNTIGRTLNRSFRLWNSLNYLNFFDNDYHRLEKEYRDNKDDKTYEEINKKINELIPKLKLPKKADVEQFRIFFEVITLYCQSNINAKEIFSAGINFYGSLIKFLYLSYQNKAIYKPEYFTRIKATIYTVMQINLDNPAFTTEIIETKFMEKFARIKVINNYNNDYDLELITTKLTEFEKFLLNYDNNDYRFLIMYDTLQSFYENFKSFKE